MFGYIEGCMNEIKAKMVKICISVTSLDKITQMINRMKTSVIWLDKITSFEVIWIMDICIFFGDIGGKLEKMIKILPQENRDKSMFDTMVFLHWKYMYKK